MRCMACIKQMGKDQRNYLENMNGKVQAEIKDLDPGKYVLKEIKAPKGYALSDETIEIVVEPGKTVNATAKIK